MKRRDFFRKSAISCVAGPVVIKSILTGKEPRITKSQQLRPSWGRPCNLRGSNDVLYVGDLVMWDNETGHFKKGDRKDTGYLVGVATRVENNLSTGHSKVTVRCAPDYNIELVT